MVPDAPTVSADGSVAAAATERRIVFMGTPEFAAVALQALIAAGSQRGHRVVAVYSQPPRPAGRGHQLQQSPVQTLAESQRLPVLTPTSIKTPEAQEIFAAHQADVAIVAAYGLLLPQAIIDLPGDKQTGVTIMQMEAGLDTGPMLLQQAVPIIDQTTASSLHDGLAELGARMIIETLQRLPGDPTAKEQLTALPQPATGVTYAAKLSRADSQLDWRRPAEELERAVRAFTPWPGVVIDFGGEKVKLLAAQRVAIAGTDPVPGAILDDDLTIACGRDALRPLLVQRPGKKPMTVADMLRGFQLPAGRLLPLPTASAEGA